VSHLVEGSEIQGSEGFLVPDVSHARDNLAFVALESADPPVTGSGELSGPEIERFLAPMRDALNENAGTTEYASSETGFHWCGAFVYYCCLGAGFTFSPKPIPDFRYTLGAVPAWQNWAERSPDIEILPASGVPLRGDIAIFDAMLSEHPLDHIGVVLDCTAAWFITAEGNVSNSTRVGPRNLPGNVHSFLRFHSLNPSAT
jgi:hypothetical protein